MLKHTDLFIVGGGLAGLTLALQARKTCPDIDITVAESRAAPSAPYIGKVGESTVEVGAHYLAEIIGQRDYLDQKQLRKFGLRFFFSEGCDDLALADEVGVRKTFDVPTYQVERSTLESHLAETAMAEGINVLYGARVTDVEMGEGDHQLAVNAGESKLKFKARWAVDASGRQNLVKKKLKLERPTQHQAASVWFRLDGKINVDDWSSSSQWRDKFGSERRWLSTNHLMGAGYWIWIIPLAGGATSVGVVFDESLHAWENFTSFDKTLDWMRIRQPLCAKAIERSQVLDFHRLKNYAYDSTQIFSESQWGLTGESGVFLDPFYSPGTDFIAYSNTMLTDLISRSRSGESIMGRAYLYQQVFESIARSTEQLYFGHYPGFFSQRMMSLKMVWDYSYYWGVLGLLFFSDSLTNLSQIRTMNADLMTVRALNADMQDRFRRFARDHGNRVQHPAGRFVDQLDIPLLLELNTILVQPLDSGAAGIILVENVEKLRRLSGIVQALLNGEKGDQVAQRELVGDLASRLAAA